MPIKYKKRLNPYSGEPQSQYWGVTWSAGKKKWKAEIQYQGKKYTLGFFNEDRVAAVIYELANLKFHGIHAQFDEKIGVAYTKGQPRQLYFGKIGPIPTSLLQYIDNRLNGVDAILSHEEQDNISRLFPENVNSYEQEGLTFAYELRKRLKESIERYENPTPILETNSIGSTPNNSPYTEIEAQITAENHKVRKVKLEFKAEELDDFVSDLKFVSDPSTIIQTFSIDVEIIYDAQQKQSSSSAAVTIPVQTSAIYNLNVTILSNNLSAASICFEGVRYILGFSEHTGMSYKDLTNNYRSIASKLVTILLGIYGEVELEQAETQLINNIITSAEVNDAYWNDIRYTFAMIEHPAVSKQQKQMLATKLIQVNYVSLPKPHTLHPTI